MILRIIFWGSIKAERGVKSMLFEDEGGKILTSEEVDELSLWEIDERRIHVYADIYAG